MARDTTPRYVLASPVLPGEREYVYEFPVQALSRTKPAASVVITHYTFRQALWCAVEWAVQFSVTQHVPVYPRVSYRDKAMMVKKLTGPDGCTAYIENASHGAWVPVEVLSL